MTNQLDHTNPTERDEARAALQQAQAGWATLKQMAKDADGCEAFRVALLQIVDLSEHGKAILARLEEALATVRAVKGEK